MANKFNLHNASKQDCIKFLIEADNAYENGNPIITDREYDALKSLIFHHWPNDPYFDYLR